MKLSAVTGANGYLGYALSKQLCESGENVRLLMHHDSDKLDIFGFEKCIGDINEIDYLLEHRHLKKDEKVEEPKAEVVSPAEGENKGE